MKTLNEHIKKGEYQKVYLIYGEEEYLKKQYRDRMKEAIIGDDTINYSYCEGKEAVMPEDISAVCSTQTTSRIFEMIEAVAGKNRDKALNLYYDLLELKESPMLILYIRHNNLSYDKCIIAHIYKLFYAINMISISMTYYNIVNTFNSHSP